MPRQAFTTFGSRAPRSPRAHRYEEVGFSLNPERTQASGLSIRIASSSFAASTVSTNESSGIGIRSTSPVPTSGSSATNANPCCGATSRRSLSSPRCPRLLGLNPSGTPPRPASSGVVKMGRMSVPSMLPMVNLTGGFGTASLMSSHTGNGKTSPPAATSRASESCGLVRGPNHSIVLSFELTLPPGPQLKRTGPVTRTWPPLIWIGDASASPYRSLVSASSISSPHCPFCHRIRSITMRTGG